jgi:hypothetical protein
VNPPVIGPELDRQPKLPGKQARREDVKFAASVTRSLHLKNCRPS